MSALLVATGFAAGPGFEEKQKSFPRVREAFSAAHEGLQALFSKQGLTFPPARIFLRAFKDERALELWVAKGKGPFAKLKEYPICDFSGRLGPKRRAGDLQVPEGFYEIDRFNPQSQFLLSLGLSYPNASDRLLGARGNLGGDIFIHGDCVSIGCLAMTDGLIREIYVAAVLARGSGQDRIPVHVFPGRLDPRGLDRLKRGLPAGADGESLWAFWQNLKEGYELFEATRVPPRPRVDSRGRYLFVR